MAQEQTRPDLSEIIAENFGANATYVEGLLARWRGDPAQVDESWRAYFEELLGADGASVTPFEGRTTTPDGSGAAGAKADGHRDGTGVAPAKPAPAKPAKTPAASETRAEAIPIRGAALKIVENMEASLSVPTATSQRRIPVKLLD